MLPDPPNFAAPKLAFDLTPAAEGARLGKLTFHFGEAEHEQDRIIQTPALLAYGKRGTPPHLTRDNVARLPIEMVSLSLEHFADGAATPSFVEAPFALHRFVGLQRTPAQSRQILTMGLRDSSDIEPLPTNHDDYAFIRTTRGAAKVTPATFLAWSLPRPPDILFGFADDPSGDLVSMKRLRKSYARSLRWVSEVAAGAQGKVPLLVPLVGSTSSLLRKQFADAILKQTNDEPSVNDRAAGYVLNVATASPNPVDPKASVTDLFNLSLASLPPTKVRTALSANGPHDILRLVRDVGIDLFVDDWSFHCASVGIGLDFDFPVPQATASNRTSSRSQLGLNFFDISYSEAFVPLSTSQLARPLPPSSGKTDQAQPFGPSPTTRAYVHHLLQAHEMTAHVILALHNQTVMHAFFVAIRALLSQGQLAFNLAVDAFFAAYEEEQPFSGGRFPNLLAAEAECNQVDEVRGRGSLREKRRLEVEEAEAAAATVQETLIPVEVTVAEAGRI